MSIEISTDFSADGETGRDWEADCRHLRQIGALATEQLTHTGVAIGLTAEIVYVLRFLGGFRGSCRFGCGFAGAAGLSTLFHSPRSAEKKWSGRIKQMALEIQSCELCHRVQKARKSAIAMSF